MSARVPDQPRVRALTSFTISEYLGPAGLAATVGIGA